MYFKVLYIRRGNDVIFACLFVALVISVAFRMESGVMNLYKWLIQNDTCFSEPRASNVFMAKVIGVCWFAGHTWKNKK